MLEKNTTRLRLAVCDDEASNRETIALLTEKILKESGISAHVTQFDSGSALLQAIEGGAVFCVLLLDVMMPELDGIELASLLRRQKEKSAIVFISSNREMALRGYEVSAVRYLAKPVQEEKLREALLYCYHNFCKQKEILIPTQMGGSRVRLSDILYAESQERRTHLIMTTGTLTINLMISELAALLPPEQFIFCHRTVLVNLAVVESIRRTELRLKNGESLPISKYRLAEVKDRLLNYLGG